jgi:hypothetical protein
MSFQRVPRWRFRFRHWIQDMLTGLPEHLRRADSGPRSPLSLVRRIGEQWLLSASNSVTADDYYLLGLHRRDLPWARKREFVGSLAGLAWLRALNAPEYGVLSDDKLVFKRYVAQAGLPTARLLALIGPHGRTEDGRPLTSSDQLRDWLREGKVENIVLKPCRGILGAGVVVLGHRVGELEWERLPAARITFDRIVTHLREHAHRRYFLVEERLEPHPALARLSPHVLHTARIVTALGADTHVMRAILRIGLGDKPVDNFAQGNLVAPIDLATGIVGAAASKRAGRARLTTHPVSGAVIAGATVPDWPAALALVQEAAHLFPQALCLAWDVALTTRGPVIQEANDIWDPHVLQLAHDRGLLAPPFGPYLVQHGATGLLGIRVSRPPAGGRRWGGISTVG